MNRIQLSGPWKWSAPSLKKEGIGQVPGSVYADLLKDHMIPDPFDQDNEYQVREIMRHEFIYERDFEIQETFGNSFLVCEGLDTLTSIFLNDQLIQQTDNMHRTYQIHVSNHLKLGQNHLKVIIHSPIEYMEKKDQERPYPLYQSRDAMKGYIHLRKGSSMMGWDWGPQLPDGGIWRDIYLETNVLERINDVAFVQEHLDTTRLYVHVQTKRFTLQQSLVKLKITNPFGSVIHESFKPTKESLTWQVEITNPSLWYPVGYGEQPLYLVEVSLQVDQDIIHQQVKRIGLRSLSLKREPDHFGESFTFVVNGVEIFARGANYIPEDNLLPRTSKEKTRRLLTLAKDANHNMIRVWGGGIYPNDEFYEICDELGLLVWQDLMFACSVYDMNDVAWIETMKQEVIDNLKRIRHHASLVLICGNNENETAIEHWNVPSKELSKAFYIQHYDTILKPLVQSLVPQIPYWLSSPSSGKEFFQDSNSDHFGDMHYWGVWHNNEPITYYRHYFPRFMSEFGIQSFPHIKTVRSFARLEDENIFSYIMEVHQKNNTANDKILNYIGKMFRYPKDFESLLYVSQLIQAEGIRYGVEHWRRNRNLCMGAIYWQLNDCYPVASWSSIDYFHRLKALYYHSKHFFDQCLLSIEEDQEKKQAKVVLANENTFLMEGLFEALWMDFEGNILESSKEIVRVPSQSVVTLLEKTYPISKKEAMDKVLLVRFYTEEKTYENQVSFVPDKHLQLRKGRISIHVENNTISLQSDTYQKYVEVSHHEEDLIFSDNYFHLFPGITKTITITSRKNVYRSSEFSIRSLVDSY